MSASGIVSRVTPVHTAVRNCTRDEGRPFGFGDQVADPKPPRAAAVKSRGGERRGNAGTMIPAGPLNPILALAANYGQLAPWLAFSHSSRSRPASVGAPPNTGKAGAMRSPPPFPPPWRRSRPRFDATGWNYSLIRRRDVVLVEQIGKNSNMLLWHNSGIIQQ